VSIDLEATIGLSCGIENEFIKSLFLTCTIYFIFSYFLLIEMFIGKFIGMYLNSFATLVP